MAPVALPEKYIFKYSCPKTELNKTLFNFEKITKDQETKKNLDNYNPTKGISRTIQIRLIKFGSPVFITLEKIL